MKKFMIALAMVTGFAAQAEYMVGKTYTIWHCGSFPRMADNGFEVIVTETVTPSGMQSINNARISRMTIAGVQTLASFRVKENNETSIFKYAGKEFYLEINSTIIHNPLNPNNTANGRFRAVVNGRKVQDKLACSPMAYTM